MKKKNLIILLLMPFIIATLCIVTVNITYDAVDVDISFIEWDYKDSQPFKLTDTIGYKLSARGVNRNNYKLADGNELVWTVQNKNGGEEPLGEIVLQDGSYYFKPLKEGEVIITCKTQKGNVSRQMTGIIWENAVIIVQPTIAASQANKIDQTNYYGQFDLNGTKKENAVIDMEITALPESILPTITASCSENISFDTSTNQITVLAPGKARLTLESPTTEEPRFFDFEIVENGVNVYTYEDLLNCTNRSKTGEIVVLRKNFESVANAYKLTDKTATLVSNNTECFGNYNVKTNKFSFDKEVYSFHTTYNKNYIDQWNEFCKSNNAYKELSDLVYVGIHVQKDFYGNGYTINLHNLTFPYETIAGSSIPQLTSDNLFRGPLPFYTLGDPRDTPLVSALGQDNIGFYVEGNNITVNDVNIKNCDFGDRVANLDYVGTVLEVYGNKITVKNSRFSNGKNVVRAFSSTDFLLKNCRLSNARNFLFSTGSNESVPINGSKSANFYDQTGKTIRTTIDEYINAGGIGDTALNAFLVTDYTTDKQARETIENILRSMHNALNKADEIKDQYHGSSVIEDCLFEKSGIAAISMDSLFNGPFLYSASPSFVGSAFAAAGEMMGGKPLVPYTATNVSGISYPVKLTIKGNTGFYDYKTSAQMDLSGLISENISTIANSLTGGSYSITIDDIFPLKPLTIQRATNYGYTHNGADGRYVNVPVAYYGGGINLSTVTVEGAVSEHFSNKVEIDLLDSYLNLKGAFSLSNPAGLSNLMMKTVTTVIGYEPFNFHFVTDGYLYGETPTDELLIENAKGDNSL